MYSEKATNFCEISTVNLSYVVTVKSKVEISQNFAAFSEYMNFIKLVISYEKYKCISVQIEAETPLLSESGRCDVSVSADQSAKLNPQEPVLEMRTLKSHSTLSSHSKGQIICRK